MFAFSVDLCYNKYVMKTIQEDNMGLIQRLDANDLKDIFRSRNRDYFSDEAYQFIVDYYDELGEDKELDVIEICCYFTEINRTVSDILEYCDEDNICDAFDLEDVKEFDIEDADEDRLIEMLEYNSNGSVYSLDNTFLIVY